LGRCLTGRMKKMWWLLAVVGIVLGAAHDNGGLHRAERAVCDPAASASVRWGTPEAAAAVERSVDINLLARVIEGEAGGEPFIGKVAVGAVILNRIRDARFPNTLSGVIFQPWAFEAVVNGRIWGPVSADSYRAARLALAGWDPTHSALYFWNPAKTVNRWIWSRTIFTRVGNHVFGK